MKISWGYGIVLVLAVFLIGMITLVVISSKQEINLVSQDYYPKGLDYQTQIDKIARTSALEHQIEFYQNAENVFLKFPVIDSTSTVEGKIQLFYPRSYRFDKEYIINVNDSLYQFISKDSIMIGKCIIKVEWKINDVDYYQEETLMLK